MGIDESRSPLTRRDVVKGAVAATLGAGSMLAGRDALALAASGQPHRRRGEIASRPRGHHRCRCGRCGRRVLPRRSVRRRPVRGAIQDRRSLRLARDRLPRPPDHGRCRRPVLPPRHASHLRHAAGAGGPLRPCPPRERTTRWRPPAACASSRPAEARRSSRRRIRSPRCRARSSSPTTRSSRGMRCCPRCRGRRPSKRGSAACPSANRSRTTLCIRGSRR